MLQRKNFVEKQNFPLKNSEIFKNALFSLSKKTTRSQKRKTVEQLVSKYQELPLSGNNQNENPVAGTSKSPKVQTADLEEIKSSLRKEIQSDPAKIFSENQKEKLELKPPVAKKQAWSTVSEESESEPKNAPQTKTSTPVEPRTTTINQKTTPLNDRYMVTGLLNDSRNLGKQRTHHPQSLQPNECPSTLRLLFAPQPGIYQPCPTCPLCRKHSHHHYQ